MKKNYLIASLLAAGFFPAEETYASVAVTEPTEPDNISIFDILRLNHKYTLAAHRSHSSHASHGSHRSSSGRSYSAPTRAVPRASPPSSSSSPSPSGPSHSAPIRAVPLVSPPSSSSSTPPPSRNLNSTPPSSVLPGSPSTAPQALPGHTERFKQIVRRVQGALFVFGYYTGALDGIVGPQTSAAISKMQTDYGLNVTGTVTPEVLNAYSITAE